MALDMNIPICIQEHWPENHLRPLYNREKCTVLNRIDATNLQRDLYPESIQSLCQAAYANCFNSVVIPPNHVRVAAEERQLLWARRDEEVMEQYRLKEDPKFLIKTVISFPNGWDSPKSKAQAIKDCLADGADICDVVLNPLEKHTRVGAVLELKEILRLTASPKKGVICPILEITDFDGDEDPFLYDIVASIASIPEILCIKTNTGVNGKARLVDVQYLAKILDNTFYRNGEGYAEVALIKAAGGIGTLDQAKAMFDAGAAMVGTSHFTEIADEFKEEEKANEHDRKSKEHE